MSKHNQNNLDALREALIGRSVTSVAMAPEGDKRTIGGKWGPTVQGEVRLDDGTVLLLAGNEGGCVCSAGDYFLTALDTMPINGITNVEIADEEVPNTYGTDRIYRVFVLAFDGGRSELARFEGSDGNGYYGTGFWFEAVRAADDRDDADQRMEQ